MAAPPWRMLLLGATAVRDGTAVRMWPSLDDANGKPIELWVLSWHLECPMCTTALDLATLHHTPSHPLQSQALACSLLCRGNT